MVTHRTYRLADVLAALSPILDRVEGQPDGHIMRSCMIGMQIAHRLALTADERSALFYALLLKDAGCSSNAAHVAALFDTDDFAPKHALKRVDTDRPAQVIAYVARNVRPTAAWWARAYQFLRVGMQGKRAARQLVQTRCERGADIARMIGFPTATANAIYSLDEHWDGTGYPDGLRGTQIPLLARVCALAQTIEVFARTEGLAAAEAMVRGRRGRWFDPALVDHFLADAHGEQLKAALAKAALATEELASIVAHLEPVERVLLATDERLDQVAEAFARIIDAKSPYTARHSARVMQIAVAMSEAMGLAPAAVRDLRRAALLHDIGKLGISNRILDKPDRLNDTEMTTMQSHASLTHETLMRIAPFRTIADIAASHHERLDGSGYPRGLTDADLGLSARILAVADVYEALTSERPYRPALPPEEALAIVRRERGTTLDAASVEMLIQLVTSGAFVIDEPLTEAQSEAPTSAESARVPRDAGATQRITQEPISGPLSHRIPGRDVPAIDVRSHR